MKEARAEGERIRCGQRKEPAKAASEQNAAGADGTEGNQQGNKIN